MLNVDNTSKHNDYYSIFYSIVKAYNMCGNNPNKNENLDLKS